MGVTEGSDVRKNSKKKGVEKSGENGEALQIEMNAMDCSQQENDRKKREERQRERGNQLERGGSWSVMVFHSRTAERERQRGRATSKTREINTTGGVLGRSCSKKKKKER